MLSTLGSDFGHFSNKRSDGLSQTKHERKCERSILGNGHSYNNGREEPFKSSNRLTKVSEGIVSEKVSDLVSEIVQLAGFHKIQPKACYAAFTFGLKYRWT